MARFRKKRSRSRGFARFNRRSARRSGSGFGGITSMVLPAAIYGAARGPIAQAISGLSAKLPFGQYNDEVAMAAVSFAANKWAPGYFKKVGMAGLIVEAASATSQATAGMISSGSSAAPNNLFVGGY